MKKIALFSFFLLASAVTIQATDIETKGNDYPCACNIEG